jgi:Arc/MetJ-type ribon-helix-helix transcriptional regulator
MTDTTVRVDEERAKALEAVSAGRAESVEAAVASAVDAWLVEQMLSQASDETLRRLWLEGTNSEDAGEIDFAAFKAEARRMFSAP